MPVLDNFRAFWAQLGERRRIGVIGGAIAIAVLTLVLAYWIFSPRYQVLFADLDPQDASAIVGELDKMKVAYRLADGGGKILVDESAVYKTRLKLMGNGIPLHGNIGFEIFDRSDYGMTEFAQKIAYQRALQGELARTIMGFDEVKFARVHLVLPESSLFRQKKSEPKASVTLLLKGDRQLAPEQVAGIQRLIAAAVSGLEPGRVTVLDHRGVMLSRAGQGDDDYEANELQGKKEIEGYLTRKVVHVLDKAFGPGQAIVSVDVTMNRDQVKSTEEDVLPAENGGREAAGVIVRRRETRQGASLAYKTAAKEGGDGGALVPARPGNTTTEVEYQVGRRVQQVVSMPGGIRRLSVGVLVPQGFDQAKLDKLREVIASVVGFSAKRGDAIVVQAVDQVAPVAANETAGTPDIVSEPSRAPIATAQTNLQQRLRNLIGAPAAWAVAALIVVGLMILAALSWGASRFGASGGRGGGLSEQEREALLADIKRWVAAESEMEAIEGRQHG